MKRGFSLFLLIILLFLLTGCAAGTDHYTSINQAGFFSGIWHGWIAPIALIIQLFGGSIRIYETNNIGVFYDLGFYLAIVGGFGSISFTRRTFMSKNNPQ